MDGFPTSGAKLCLIEHKDVCYEIPAHVSEGPGSVAYQFGLNPRSERLPLSNGGSVVFFSGTFSGGGSGTLERIAVLRYETDGNGGKIVNLLPFVGATDVSERAMWRIPGVSSYPILVHADFIWGEGEDHFGEHHYTVEAWRLDPASDRYVRAFSYRTARRYSGGDTTPIRVLSAERPQILRRLAMR